MSVKKIHGNIIYQHNYYAENGYRQELSGKLLAIYGKSLIDQQEEVRDAINFSLNYFIENFSKICLSEKSLSFYQHILFLHDQATDLTYAHQADPVSETVDFFYIAKYRRILKYIIEQTCDNNLISREPSSPFLIARVEATLNELLYLGEMILMCTELFAEQDMIEDLAQLSFDNHGLFVFSRKHHYNEAFKEIVLNDWGAHLTKEAYDINAINDFKEIIKTAFGIEYNHIGHLLASIHEQFKDNAGEYTGFNWDGLIYNLKESFKIPIENSEPFFKGLTLDKTNKKPLLDLACKPYLLTKHLYRPIIIWTVDNKEFAFVTKSSWTESIIQLTTNAIPWGKAPIEWLRNKTLKQYMHRKEDSHDIWLDNEVEIVLEKHTLKYLRNVKSINGQSIIKVPGEIDFLVISQKLSTVFVIECKHLLGRYDMENQKIDYMNFVTGNKNKSYNEQLRNKFEWIKTHLKLLENHFCIELKDFSIRACFIINTPTFYMFNSVYRLYTVSQFEQILQSTFIDKEFVFKNRKQKYKVCFPYFKKPDYYETV